MAQVWAKFALGDLALATGDTGEAIRHYLGRQSMLRDIGFGDVDVAPGPELAEAQLRHGEPAAAKQTAHDYFCLAREKGQPWALARAHRAVALNMTDSGEQAAQFETALGAP